MPDAADYDRAINALGAIQLCARRLEADLCGARNQLRGGSLTGEEAKRTARGFRLRIIEFDRVLDRYTMGTAAFMRDKALRASIRDEEEA